MAFQEKEYRRRLSLAQSRNTLITLIAINLILYVGFAFIKALFYLKFNQDEVGFQFHRSVLNWFTLPASASQFIYRPWTLLTHMFVHDDIFLMIGNMLWLWLFGFILHDLTGNKKIFPIYLYGSFAAAVVFLISYNLIPGFKIDSIANLAGASAGIMAIAVAVTTIAPDFKLFPMLFGGIPVWVFTAIYFVIDISSIAKGNYPIYLAHATGALMGYLFIVGFRRGSDWGGWMNNFFDWVNDLFNPDKPSRRNPEKKSELFYKSGKVPYKKTPNVTTQRIDEILDKINSRGFDSLTDEEKELLQRASKEDI